MLSFAAGGVAVVVLFVLLAYVKFGRLAPTSIPGRKGLPFVGDTPHIFWNYGPPRFGTHDFIQDCAKLSPTKLASFHLFTKLMVVVSDHKLAKQILLQPRIWRPSQRFNKAFSTVCRGLLVLEGDEWSRHRRLLHKAFEPAQLKQVAPATNQMMDVFVQLWQSHGPKAFTSKAHFAGLTMDVIGLCAFDESFHGLDNPTNNLATGLEYVTLGVQQRIPTPPFAWKYLPHSDRFNDSKARVRDYLTALVARRKQAVTDDLAGAEARQISSDNTAGRKRDILSLMLATQRMETRDVPLTDSEIVHELIMFFLAGHETSSNCLTWTTMFLAQHPGVQDKLAAEVRRVCGDDKPTYDSIKQLKYCEAVLKESLRLRPVVALGVRFTEHGTELQGHALPPKSQVFLNYIGIHKDPKLWGPDAAEFRPERWLDETNRVPADTAYFPFGGGRKACIGRVFAMMEMKVVLARLAQFLAGRHLALTPGQDIVAQTTITLNPQRDILLDILD